MDFCDVYSNPSENYLESSKYACNLTRDGVNGLVYQNANCSGEPYAREDVTADIYKFDCSTEVCNSSDPTVGYQALSNCSTNGNPVGLTTYNFSYY